MDVITIGMTVPQGAQQLTVRIWDRFGDPVRVLVDERNPSAGRRLLTWDRSDDTGERRLPASSSGGSPSTAASESRLTRLQ